MTVTARDAYGNTVPTYTGTIQFTSSDPAATLPANYTFTGADAGVQVFSGGVTLKTAGTRSITATDTLTPTITGSQTGIAVTPGAAATFAVVTVTSWVAGAAHSVTVTARDAYGNVATGYTGTIRFTSSDPAATLPANYTFSGSDAGVHAFSLGATLKTAGTRSITATDTAHSGISGSQTGIAVTPGAAATLTVVTVTSWVAGAAHSVTVTARDAYGNVVPTYTGTIHFTSSDLAATLPANYTFSGSDAGVHVFSGGVTLRTAGARSITATDTAHSGITGSQVGIIVS